MDGSEAPPLLQNGIPIAGANVISFWMMAPTKGCSTPMYMFKQPVDLGGGMRKGENAWCPDLPGR
jgi:antirestriction protein ArdC